MLVPLFCWQATRKAANNVHASFLLAKASPQDWGAAVSEAQRAGALSGGGETSKSS